MMAYISVLFVISVCMGGPPPPIAPPVWQPWINDPPTGNLSYTDQQIINDLEKEFNQLPNVTSEVHPRPWEIPPTHRGQSPSVFPTDFPSMEPATEQTANANESYFHRRPTETTQTCPKLFQAYKAIKYELECLLNNLNNQEIGVPFQQKLRNLNGNVNDIDTETEDVPRLIYLRQFSVTSNKAQQLYWDVSKSHLVIGFKRLRHLNLRNFISWLKVQSKLLKILLPLQTMLKNMFQVKYPDLKTELPEPTTKAPASTTPYLDTGLRFRHHIRHRHTHHQRNRNQPTNPID